MTSVTAPSATEAPRADGPRELTQRPLQLQGSRIARALLRLAGWQLQWDGLPGPQGVVVVYPHTSNWDFVVGILAKWAIGLPATFLGKHSLFGVPLFGRWLRWLGGRPVLRSAPQGVVGQMAQQLRDAREAGQFMWLVLAPEGTRGWRPGWRSGFYRVALEAGVPVALVRLDFAHRRVGFDSFWTLSGDLGADFATFARRFADCRGYHPQLAAPVRPLPP